MALHAVDDLSDAFDATREFLFPFDRRRWLRLAVMAFFLGGTGGTSPPMQFSGDFGRVPDVAGPRPLPTDVLHDLGPNAWLVVAALVATVVLLALAFGVVGCIFEFGFLRALVDDEVAVRDSLRRFWKPGLRLFGFRLVLGLVSLAVAGVFVLFAVGGFLAGTPLLGLLGLLVAFPLLVVIGLVVGVGNAFTTFFVVPVMYREECGVVAGWRRLWPTVRAEWKEYAAFAVVGFVLTLAIGVLVGLVLGVAAIVVAIPVSVVFGVPFVLLQGTVAFVLLAVGVVVFLLVMVVVGAFAQVPVQAFLRYYGLFVLGDTDPDLDLIPERRAAVRE
ncbi:DUF7544 domain-containing protein [Halospeciosus flavus]|uniref:Glycerophosphoryl diester phosphodiesterase membrane domain-containing protein n=1 Tax=Halospeciosus flavus TaxID=3032283 RepID=A0ABD5Z7Z6_9EURY|nr:hypothetical protein [Halospeciosus flavus]